MKIKVYEKYEDEYDEYIDDYSTDAKNVDVISITESDGNYVVILNKENYLGKSVFLYDKKRFFIVCDYDINQIGE